MKYLLIILFLVGCKKHFEDKTINPVLIEIQVSQIDKSILKVSFNNKNNYDRLFEIPNLYLYKEDNENYERELDDINLNYNNLLKKNTITMNNSKLYIKIPKTSQVELIYKIEYKKRGQYHIYLQNQIKIQRDTSRYNQAKLLNNTIFIK